MQDNANKTSTLNLKQLLALELMFLGICIWFGFSLYAGMEVSIWYQSSVKMIVTVLLLATFPLQSVHWVGWKKIVQYMQSLCLPVSMATALFLLFYMRMGGRYESRDIFALAFLFSAVAVLSCRLLKKQ